MLWACAYPASIARKTRRNMMSLDGRGDVAFLQKVLPAGITGAEGAGDHAVAAGLPSAITIPVRNQYAAGKEWRTAPRPRFLNSAGSCP